MNLKQFIHSHPRFNAVRRLVRFLQRVPPRDLVRPHVVLTALRVRPYTLLNYPRLATLYSLTRVASPGAIVECGSYNGGSAAMMAAAAPNREFWLFDSWEGLPEPGPEDVGVGGKVARAGADLGDLERVEELLFEKLSCDRSKFHFVKGWFENTLPAAGSVGRIGLLHIDADWYDSVRLALAIFWDRLAPGAVLVVDDYGHWLGCRKAVDEFCERVPLELHAIDEDAVYAIKPVNAQSLLATDTD